MNNDMETLENKSTVINKTIVKQDLFNVIKHGHTWYAEKIKEELRRIIFNNSHIFDHDFNYDREEKYHFIYDDECHLFIFDGQIELRSDRDNVFSSDKTFIYKIRGKQDVLTAYEHFKSLLMEDEND